MRKADDWINRLGAFEVANWIRPFKWGEFDCCLAACDLIRFLTGIDPAEKFRGTYSDELGAKKHIGDFGSVGELAVEVLGSYGFEELELPKTAQRGDIALISTPEYGETLGFVSTSGRIAAPGARGLVFYPITEILRGWKV